MTRPRADIRAQANGWHASDRDHWRKGDRGLFLTRYQGGPRGGQCWRVTRITRDASGLIIGTEALADGLPNLHAALDAALDAAGGAE